MDCERRGFHRIPALELQCIECGDDASWIRVQIEIGTNVLDRIGQRNGSLADR